MKTSFVLVTTTMGGLYHVFSVRECRISLKKGQRKSTYNFRTPHPCPKKELFVYRISKGGKAGENGVYERMGQFWHGLRTGDEDGLCADVASELHVAEGVADHDRRREGYLREFHFRPEPHAGIGFPAGTRLVEVWTVIDPVDASARGADHLHHAVMDGRQVLFGHETLADAFLVGDDEYQSEPCGEGCDGFGNPIIKPEFIRFADVVEGLLMVDDTIPVEEKGPCGVDDSQVEHGSVSA